MSGKSWLPQGGTNLFQGIKKMCDERTKNGHQVWRLTIGQPQGPALMSARQACAEAVLSDLESMHEYQDNGSPGIPNFARDFIELHISGSLKDYEGFGQIKFLPIPGIKSMLGYIILSTGQYRLPQGERFRVGTMTDPGYPTPEVQCGYFNVPNYRITTNPDNRFLFSARDIPPLVNLIMCNYPHNPSGQIATEEFWMNICQICSNYKIRLFNDAAYAMLAHSKKNRMLAEIAPRFPKLSWAEAYSASKVIANGTGWRIGAMVGSADFIDDISTIKGNCDSGFFAPAAVGTLRCMQNDMEGIKSNRDMFGTRIGMLISLLKTFNMKLAVHPGAGFFTLWQAPKQAFGKKIEDGKKFNDLMIEKTGVAGVPFGPYIRYAVTSPIENPEWLRAISDGFEKANVKY